MVGLQAAAETTVFRTGGDLVRLLGTDVSENAEMHFMIFGLLAIFGWFCFIHSPSWSAYKIWLRNSLVRSADY